MPIFKIEEGKCRPVLQDKFNNENELRSLIDDNLRPLFGLELVAKQRKVPGTQFILDTIAFDPEPRVRAFVIIEYKEEKHSSITDQGMAYFHALQTHKSFFEKLLQEVLRQTNPDFEQSRLMFIARRFSNHQQAAIG